jgi:hypothetical protein
MLRRSTYATTFAKASAAKKASAVEKGFGRQVGLSDVADGRKV